SPCGDRRDAAASGDGTSTPRQQLDVTATCAGQFGSAAEVLLPHLLPIAAEFDPENTGGARLLGVDGVCVISHGSSSSTAMVNAIRVAHDLAKGGLVDHLAAAVAPA
ncbi:MAG TPA: hypothetical protein VIJ60_13180, partial [Acidimicrobiales bacterium]